MGAFEWIRVGWAVNTGVMYAVEGFGGAGKTGLGDGLCFLQALVSSFSQSLQDNTLSYAFESDNTVKTPKGLP